MKQVRGLVRFVARFAVGLGTLVALISAAVIVTTDVTADIGLGGRPVEVIRLDPVVVTISSDRYEAIRAEQRGETAIVRGRVPRVEEG